MTRLPIGARVRERRKAAGLTQTALAGKIGVSASYLNLIEHDRRRIGGALLARLTEALDAPSDAFDGVQDQGLVQALRGLAADPALADLALGEDDPIELVARWPGWARAVRRLHDRYGARDREARALADRLSHDPELADALHLLLSKASAVQATAQILGVDDLDPDDATRFRDIVASESSALALVAKNLVALFEMSEQTYGQRDPFEEVDDFLYQRGNYFDALEDAAAALGVAASGPDRWRGVVVDLLERRFGLRVVDTEPSHPVLMASSRQSAFDAAARTLHIDAGAADATRRFELARCAAALMLREEIEAEVSASKTLVSGPAQDAARGALASYAAGAALLPYEPFFDAAESSRYDVERLGRRFQTSFEQTAHRLVTLRRTGSAAPAFAFMRADPSGFVTKRFPLPNLALPGQGGACPIWTVFRAFQTPDRVVRDLVEFPDEQRFLMMAQAISKPGRRYGGPRRTVSIMLACDAVYAERLVYGDAVTPVSTASAVAVGSRCALCAREGCEHRHEPSLLLSTEPSGRTASL